MRTLIILPVHNEAKNLPELVKRILDTNRGLKILIIDDNSTDNSSQISLELSNANPSRVFFIKRKLPRGRGVCVIEGYKFARSQGFDYVIEMDADFSHDPRCIPLLIDTAKDADMVIGSRYLKGGSIKGRSFYRNVISYLANIYLRFLLGVSKIKDITSGYRCINMEFLKRLNLDSFESSGPELLEEIIFKNKGRIRVKEIPIVFQERTLGKSKFGFLMALKCFFNPLRWRILNKYNWQNYG